MLMSYNDMDKREREKNGNTIYMTVLTMHNYLVCM
jgi:hypothetical protein